MNEMERVKSVVKDFVEQMVWYSTVEQNYIREQIAEAEKSLAYGVAYAVKKYSDEDFDWDDLRDFVEEKTGIDISGDEWVDFIIETYKEIASECNKILLEELEEAFGEECDIVERSWSLVPDAFVVYQKDNA